MKRTENKHTQKRSVGLCLKGLACACLFLACAFSNSALAQETRPRSARSLTSEDLLNRPVIYVPKPAQPTGASSRAVVRVSASAATSYRDPSGTFSLSFPSSDWRANAKVVRGVNFSSQRSFRKIESEGFASASTNVYVLAEGINLPAADAARMSADGQRELATMLATHFLSNNVSLVSTEPLYLNGRGVGLRVIADQLIARRAQVRAAISVFERGGRLYVVVCRASVETFDANTHEFEAITNSLASSAARS